MLLQCLHVNDNTKMKSPGDPGYDHLHKIHPLLTNVNDNCHSNYNLHCRVRIDEAMVGFKGISSLKQYLPMKPNPLRGGTEGVQSMFIESTLNITISIPIIQLYILLILCCS